MPGFVVLGSVAAFATFLMTLVVVPDVSPHPLIIRISVALVAALVIGSWFLIMASVRQQRDRDREARLQPYEHELMTVKPHKFTVVAPCVPFVLFGSMLLLFGIVLLIGHPDVHFTVGGHQVLNNPGKITRPKQFHFPIWEIPVVFSLPLFVSALAIWQRWKLTWWIVTTQNFLDIREQSVLLPWLGHDSQPYPLYQVVDVKDVAGVFGGMFGWTTVTVFIRLDIGQDAPTRLMLRFVPQARGFATYIRSVSPALNGTQQSGLPSQPSSPPAQTQPLPPTS